MATERIPVRVRDCSCPGQPHVDGDVVYLLPVLSLEGGAAAEYDLLATQSIEDENRRTYAMLAKWTATFVRYGAVGWNWIRLDGDGRSEPVPFDVELLLADYSISRLIAEQANNLYSEAVMRPLFETAAANAPTPNRQQRRSRTGRTAGSTSPLRASTSKRPASSSEPGSDGPALRIAR